MTTAEALQSRLGRVGRARLLRGSRLSLAAGTCLLTAVALWLSAAGTTVDPRELGDTGLVTALPPVVIAAAVLVCASFVLTVRDPAGRGVLLAAHVVLLVLVLQGTPALIEDVSRFHVTWRHLGVVESLTRTEALHPEIDAYFNWPGFFALAALVFEALGIENPGAVVQWSGVALGLLYLAPVLAIARWFFRTARASWLAVWIFCLANWVGQDYFAPQGLAYLGFLVVVALVLTSVQPSASHRAVHLGCAAFLVAVVVPTHQLTPLAIGLALAAIAGVYRSRHAALLALSCFALVGLWLLTGARTFAEGHLGAVLDDIGAIGSSVGSSVGARIDGSAGHLLVVQTRIAVAVIVVALAAAGAVVLLRRRRTTELVCLCALALAPVLLVAVQGYGGEIALRAYFFALPFYSVLAAGLVAGGPGLPWSPLRTAAIAALTLVLLLAFPLTRYGNERADAFATGELAAVEALYRVAPPGSTLVTLAEEGGPWKFRGYERYRYRALTELPQWRAVSEGRRPARVLLAELRRAAAPEARVFVVLLRSQVAALELLDGADPRRLGEITASIEGSPRLRVVTRNPDAAVLELEAR